MVIAIVYSSGAASGFLNTIFGFMGKLLGIKMVEAQMIYSIAGYSLAIQTSALSISVGAKILAGAYAVGSLVSSFSGNDPPSGDETEEVIRVETNCSKDLNTGSDDCPIPWIIRAGKWFRNSAAGMNDSMSLGLYSKMADFIAGAFGQNGMKIDQDSDGYFHGQVIHGVATTVFLPGAGASIQAIRNAGRSGLVIGNTGRFAVSLKIYRGHHFGVIRNGGKNIGYWISSNKTGGKAVLRWRWKNGPHRKWWGGK